MHNGRLVSYKTIASTIQRDFPFVTESVTDEEVIEWLGSFMGLTNCPVVLEDKIEHISVCDGKGHLPCDLHLIMQVGKPDTDVLEEAPCAERMAPMRWKTDRFHTRYHASDSDFHSDSMYTYTVSDNCIYPNFHEGIVSIAYKAIPTDDQGFPMIPADEQWVQAAVHDIAWKTARKLWYSNKMSTDKFQKIEMERDHYFAQAVTYSKMPSIDQRESIKNDRLRSYTNIDHHQDFFRNYQMPEHRYFRGQYFSGT
tara:strand:+ start:1152 stop:1913 length:762 start_codon:yes stop_codon:yes gene_type:complete